MWRMAKPLLILPPLLLYLSVPPGVFSQTALDAKTAYKNRLSEIPLININIAPRVAVEVGTQVRVRGEYLWNLQGGIIHKTHRDQRSQTSGGWIEVMITGKRYE